MIPEAANFAGFLSAHAVFSISSGETLIPLYGYIDKHGKQVAMRMEQDRIEAGVSAGQEMMETNPHNTNIAVFIHDAFIRLDASGDKKIDCLFIEIRTYGENTQKIVMGLPYKHNNPNSDDIINPPEFAIFNLDVHDFPEDMSDNDMNSFFRDFFEGCDSHTEGSEIWHKHSITLPANDTIDKYEAILTKKYYASPKDSYVLTENENSDGIVYKHDDASWHYNNDFPEDLPQEAGATHIGMFVVWCLLNGMGGQNIQDVKKLADRDISPGLWFYKTYDGKFTNDVLSEEGNIFANRYFSLNDGEYIDDYESIIDESLKTIYHMPDTWKTYDILDPIIKRRFESLKAVI